MASTTSTAEAFAAGVAYGASTVPTGTYNMTPATPTFSPTASGTFTTPQSVTIADASPGVMLYYTTDGSTPTTGSTQYTGRLRSQPPPQSEPSLPVEGTA